MLGRVWTVCSTVCEVLEVSTS